MDKRLVYLVVFACASSAAATMQFHEGSIQGFYVCRDPFGCMVVFTATPATPVENLTPTPKMLFYEGSQENFLLCRDPFTCQVGGGATTSPTCTAIVNITWPLNGSTYYFPSITPDLNYTLEGAVNPYCEYRINSGGWNNATCANGNNTFGPTTMPEGYPVSVTVRVNDSGCSTTDTIEFSVHYGGGMMGATQPLWWAPWLTVVFALVYGYWRQKHELLG